MLSDHFDGRRFFNPDIGEAARQRSLLRILRWRLQGNRPAWPPHVDNIPYLSPAGERTVTFIGHATFLIRLPGLTILTDPVFSDRATPIRGLGPRRVRAPGIALRDLPPIDVILLSHNHYDHADLPSLRTLSAHRPHAVTLLGNAPLLARAGILAATELDWFGETAFGATRITATPARHFSRRGLSDGNRALWGGFMVEHAGHRLFFAGDSGAGPHWADIATRLGPPDLALIPIGAYEPRWIMAPVHMNPEEAVQAHLALQPRHAIGMHFGTFRLTDEAIDAPPETLRAICAREGITNFTTLDVGETAPIPA